MKINGKEYIAKELDFNMVCDLTSMGVDIYANHIPLQPLLRAYFAICAGLTVTEAGNEIQAHVVNGGDLTELQASFNDAMDNSGFFKALLERKAAKA